MMILNRIMILKRMMILNRMMSQKRMMILKRADDSKGNQSIISINSIQTPNLETSPSPYPLTPKIPDFLRKRNARKVLTGGKERKQNLGKTGAPERFPEGRSLQEVLSLWLSI